MLSIDSQQCVSCGICIAHFPHVIKQTDFGFNILAQPSTEFLQDVVEICPMNAIIKEEKSETDE